MTETKMPLVNTLINGLRILETLAFAERPSLGVTEIANRLRLHKSTVLRLLATLEHERYVEQDPETREFRLRMKLFEIGSSLLARVSLTSVARPFLEELGRLAGEVIHLAILDEGTVIYIDKVESKHTIQMYSRIGRRSPVHCTGVGKALIAYLSDEELDRIIEQHGLKRYTQNTITDKEALKRHLAQIRSQEVAFDNEEHEPGIRCVAAPVRDYTGKVIASISVAGPTLRMTPERAQALVEPVQHAARRVSEELGYRAQLVARAQGAPIKEGLS
ncbi:MAG: IclR family transcriptional regulator [Firmicutes bacterium]|nr:IclR family transcriptional regulator [Bacillota bacterium]